MFIVLFFVLNGALAAAGISISPVAPVFERVAVLSSSEAISFTISNDGTNDLSLGSLFLTGSLGNAFTVQNDYCSDQVLTGSATCTLEILFSPLTDGKKFANLIIPSDDPETPILNAAVSNYESIEEEATRRLQPVLNSLDIPEVMTSGSEYTLNWSVLGYQRDTKTIIALFNCDGQTNCGANYDDASRFETSGKLSAYLSEAGSWQYAGLDSTLYHYTFTFTAPVVSQSTDMVIRFYQISLDDEESGGVSLSLLIPGNLSGSYYDTSGRKIRKTIVP